jgi:hypothetical protein
VFTNASIYLYSKSVAILAAPPLPNPPPDQNAPYVGTGSTIIGYLKEYGWIAAFITLLVGFIVWGVGKISQNTRMQGGLGRVIFGVLGIVFAIAAGGWFISLVYDTLAR